MNMLHALHHRCNRESFSSLPPQRSRALTPVEFAPWVRALALPDIALRAAAVAWEVKEGHEGKLSTRKPLFARISTRQCLYPLIQWPRCMNGLALALFAGGLFGGVTGLREPPALPLPAGGPRPELVPFLVAPPPSPSPATTPSPEPLAGSVPASSASPNHLAMDAKSICCW